MRGVQTAQAPLSFEGMFPSDGLLHAIDNASEELCKAMPGHAAALRKLRDLCRLVRGVDSRPSPLGVQELHC